MKVKTQQNLLARL